MNESDDLDAVLTDGAVTDATPVAAAVVDVTVDPSTDEVTDAAAVAVPAAAPAPVAKKAKGRAGRPFDASGATNLGKARNLYATEPSLSAADLRKRLIADFGIPEKSAQTYASLVRKGKK